MSDVNAGNWVPTEAQKVVAARLARALRPHHVSATRPPTPQDEILAALKALPQTCQRFRGMWDREEMHEARDSLVLKALRLFAPDLADAAEAVEDEVGFWYS